MTASAVSGGWGDVGSSIVIHFDIFKVIKVKKSNNNNNNFLFEKTGTLFFF